MILEALWLNWVGKFLKGSRKKYPIRFVVYSVRKVLRVMCECNKIFNEANDSSSMGKNEIKL